MSLSHKITRLYGAKGWAAIFAFMVVVLVVFPLLNLVVPKDSVFYLSDYFVALAGKIMCYAMVALAMDLIWGYTGILSLGHGLFFALGGYAMGMYLMRSIGLDGVYHSPLPDFMVFLDWKAYPWYWAGTSSFWYCALLVVLVPGLLAFAFGFFAFRSRIKGVYFSIITQALTFAFMLLFFRNDTGFGGNNGFTDFKRILDFPIATSETRMALFVITGSTLIATLLLARYLVQSKFGRVLTAIRDAESRVMFSGYNPLWYKLFIWTLSAVICGIAGALYVPQVGIINPSEMSPANSIEIAIWVAVGGRGTLVGALLGAGIVNGAKSWFTVAFPEYWLFFLGLLFIAVTLFMPKGVMGLRRSDQGAPRMNMAAVPLESHDDPQASQGRVIEPGAVDLAHGAILYLEDISVSFDGFKALNNLSLMIETGELRCIIGPNGAGKTTMMDVITGKTRADTGTAFFGQNIDLSRLSEAEIAHAGIGRKFQKPTVFEAHSVFENLELAMKVDKRVRHSLTAELDSAQRDKIAATLAMIHLDESADRPAGLLSHGQKQWLEIGMLLMQEPQLLLLDEPVAGMTDEETERTAELCNTLAGQHSLVVVEHDMDFVTRIARKVTVLHEGSVLAEGSMDTVQNDQRVIEVYLGR